MWMCRYEFNREGDGVVRKVSDTRDWRGGATGVICAVTLCVLFGLSCSSAFALNEHAFSRSFAEPGSAAGQLSSPTGIAVNDTTHNVYVLDTANNRVEVF